MGRWLLILVGPLPATVLLLPFLFAGGLGEVIALGAALVDHRRSGAERWATVTTSSGSVGGYSSSASKMIKRKRSGGEPGQPVGPHVVTIAGAAQRRQCDET